MSDAPAHARERILPEGTVELVCNLAEDEIRIYDAEGAGAVRRYSGTVVSGAFSGCFGIDTREHASIVGVHFKPAGAFPFLGLPLHEVADTHVDLESIWGGAARALRERLCAAPLPADRFRLLEAALLDRLQRPPRRHPVVPYALAQLEQPDHSVAAVAERAGLSHRRLTDVFRAEVGMTPKLFARIRRFERAVELARRVRDPEWARLAQGCGYFDQSHMIRDFAAFSGLTPVELLGQSSSHVKDGHLLG
jgi:AraC-like DNA-binding protein